MSHPFISTNTVEKGHNSDIYSIATCEAYTATGSGDGSIKLWDNSEAEPSGVDLTTGATGIHHIAIDFEGRYLAAVGFDARLRIFDLKTADKATDLAEIEKVSLDSWAVAFAARAPLLAISTIEGDVNVWDVDKAKQIQSFSTIGKGFGVSVDISQDGELAAVGFEKGGLYLYDTHSGRLAYSLTGHSSTIRAIAFSPSGNLVAAAGDSKIISLYDTKSGEHITNLNGHEGWIFSLRWNETGELLLSTSYDGKAKVWSMESRSCVATQADSNSPLLCAAWLNKEWGKNIIAGFNQGFVTAGIEKSIRWYREAAGK